MKPEARTTHQKKACTTLTEADEKFRIAKVDYEFAIAEARKWLSVRQVGNTINKSKSQISRGSFTVPIRTDWADYMAD